VTLPDRSSDPPDDLGQTALVVAHPGHELTVAYGAQLPGITELRIGTGRNNTARRLLARIKKLERHLGWRVSPDGWVRFSPAADGTR
jgi:hypothetical protein